MKKFNFVLKPGQNLPIIGWEAFARNQGRRREHACGYAALAIANTATHRSTVFYEVERRAAGKRSSRRKDRAGGYRNCIGYGKDAAPDGD